MLPLQKYYFLVSMCTPNLSLMCASAFLVLLFASKENARCMIYLCFPKHVFKGVLNCGVVVGFIPLC